MALSPVKELVNKYRGEFKEAYDSFYTQSLDLTKNLQEQLQQLNENWESVQPQVYTQKDKILQGLQNVQEPIQESSNDKLLPIFAWISIMQFGFSVGAHLSTYLLYPIYMLFLGKFWSAIFAFVLLPSLAYLYFCNGAEEESTARFQLLTFSLAEGSFVGYLFAYRYLPSILPIGFLSPLAVAIVTSLVSTYLQNKVSRVVLLSACLGSGLLLHLSAGMLFSHVSFSYLFLALLYTSIAYFTIQLYLTYLNDESSPENLDMLCMLSHLVLTSFAQALVLLVFGYSVTSTSDLILDEIKS